MTLTKTACEAPIGRNAVPWRATQRRKRLVKTPAASVKKALGTPFDLRGRPTFWHVAVIAYVLLTIAAFAVFGIIQKALES